VCLNGLRVGVSSSTLAREVRLDGDEGSRIVAFDQLRRLFDGPWTAGDVVAFHTAHKLTLMAHMPAAYRSLGRLVATVRHAPRDEFREAYLRQFMAALAVPSTQGRHMNVLEHMLGYFKRSLDVQSRAELRQAIENYSNGKVTLSVPLALFRHHIQRENIEYLARQVYLTHA
jgi:uncharacterized protein YbgA (DUF1722 family)